MKNVVTLQINEDGDIYCQQITKKGKEFLKTKNEDNDNGYWEPGGVIILEELEEILKKEI